jgi:hypothetical protein
MPASSATGGGEGSSDTRLADAMAMITKWTDVKSCKLYIDHTREGIGYSHQPAGQVDASNGNGGGLQTRKHRAQNKNLFITITRNQIITLVKRGMGTSLLSVSWPQRGQEIWGGGADTQTTDPTSSLLTRPNAPDKQGT